MAGQTGEIGSVSKELYAYYSKLKNEGKSDNVIQMLLISNNYENVDIERCAKRWAQEHLEASATPDPSITPSPPPGMGPDEPPEDILKELLEIFSENVVIINALNLLQKDGKVTKDNIISSLSKCANDDALARELYSAASDMVSAKKAQNKESAAASALPPPGITVVSQQDKVKEKLRKAADNFTAKMLDQESSPPSKPKPPTSPNLPGIVTLPGVSVTEIPPEVPVTDVIAKLCQMEIEGKGFVVPVLIQTRLKQLTGNITKDSVIAILKDISKNGDIKNKYSDADAENLYNEAATKVADEAAEKA